MIKIKFIILLVILSTMFSSCTQSKINDSTKNDITSSTNLLNDHQSVGYSAKELNYKFNYEVIKANNVVEYQQIDFPKEINGNKVALVGLFNQYSFLVVLYSEVNVPITHEMGIYNLRKKSYQKLCEFEADEAYKVCDFNNDFVVLEKTNNNWVDISLHIISIKDTTTEFIHKYSDSSTKNSVLIKENEIFFDDINTKDDNMNVDLYCYNFITKEKRKIKKDMQNPIKYENTVFSIINKYPDIKVESTVYTLMNLTENRAILETAITIDRVEASSHFVTWGNHDITEPYIYSIKDKKIIKFDINAGYNYYFLKDNYGILLNTFYDNSGDYYKNRKYYLFKYKIK